MAATGRSQRISPPAMARLYAVHYASSCACAFGWRFHAYYRCCVLLTRGRLDQRVSHLQTSAAVWMTNLGNGIHKRFRSSSCYTALQASFIRVCSKFRAFLSPLRQRFPFPAFPQTLQPASQAATTSSYTFLTDITDRKGDARRFPRNTVRNILAQHQPSNIFAGVPPTTRFNQFICAYPARENFGTQKIASFHQHTTRKNRCTSKFHTPQFAVRGRDTQRTTLNAQNLAPTTSLVVA